MKKESTQIRLKFTGQPAEKRVLLSKIRSLIRMHKDGMLGGEVMPEDARPTIINPPSSENYHFLTLPMALNYQRNSYKLWDSAAKTYLDDETRDVFIPHKVRDMPADQLRGKLLRHKLALQPTKHIDTWKRVSTAIADLSDGDIRHLFEQNDNDVVKIRGIIQGVEKKRFPYLSGDKIFNYWLYVIEIYTPTRWKNRSEITVAPDTHVIQSSLRLGLIVGSFDEITRNRSIIADEWKNILVGSGLSSIDIHTPLWLWSKRGFPEIISHDSFSTNSI